MDTIILILGILGLMLVSLIATHLWVSIWDAIGLGIKKLFHIGKKETIHWHTLDQTKQAVEKVDIVQTTSQISENERLH